MDEKGERFVLYEPESIPYSWVLSVDTEEIMRILSDSGAVEWSHGGIDKKNPKILPENEPYKLEEVLRQFYLNVARVWFVDLIRRINNFFPLKNYQKILEEVHNEKELDKLEIFFRYFLENIEKSFEKKYSNKKIEAIKKLIKEERKRLFSWDKNNKEKESFLDHIKSITRRLVGWKVTINWWILKSINPEAISYWKIKIINRKKSLEHKKTLEEFLSYLHKQVLEELKLLFSTDKEISSKKLSQRPIFFKKLLKNYENEEDATNHIIAIALNSVNNLIKNEFTTEDNEFFQDMWTRYSNIRDILEDNQGVIKSYDELKIFSDYLAEDIKHYIGDILNLEICKIDFIRLVSEIIEKISWKNESKPQNLAVKLLDNILNKLWDKILEWEKGVSLWDTLLEYITDKLKWDIGVFGDEDIYNRWYPKVLPEDSWFDTLRLELSPIKEFKDHISFLLRYIGVYKIWYEIRNIVLLWLDEVELPIEELLAIFKIIDKNTSRSMKDERIREKLNVKCYLSSKRFLEMEEKGDIKELKKIGVNFVIDPWNNNKTEEYISFEDFLRGEFKEFYNIYLGRNEKL